MEMSLEKALKVGKTCMIFYTATSSQQTVSSTFHHDEVAIYTNTKFSLGRQ